MSSTKPIAAGHLATSAMNGWRGVALVAITYIYFLIFAQFAFLQRLAQLHIAEAHLEAVMAAMAFGGILFSLLTPRTQGVHLTAGARLRIALTFCAVAALLPLLPLNLPASIATAFLIGASLGTLTVTLVTHLRLWIGTTNPLLKVGLGTGLGYLVCNFPPLFTASPEVQALTAAMLCLAAVFLAATVDSAGSSSLTSGTHIAEKDADHSRTGEGRYQSNPFPLVLLAFTALIWLDSAAFFIIQNTPNLKAGTWQGTAHLYLNGALHLLAALVSAYILRHRGLSTALSAALLALAAACLLLLDPHRAFLASLFYPIGVSLYSVALVAYPALLSGASSTAERGRQAGWIYAIGGWFGSAMGIGMGQHLGHIPPLFILIAAALILAPTLFRARRREFLATSAILLAAAGAWATQKSLRPAPSSLSQVDRGRQVYISEGCINCHSQFVRSNTPDVLLWGPVQTVAELRAQRPPLIGNRRQGPDLSEVAMRRSPLWMRAHFYEPSQISHGSIMPAFAHLFRDGEGSDTRGDDLIAYLETLHPIPTATAQHRASELTWQPSPAAFAAASTCHGERLYEQECSTCHNPNGATRVQWRTSFRRLPTILSTGPNFDIKTSITPVQLAQIIKFGIPATDMAGHEYLSDADVASLTLYLQQIVAQPVTTATNTQYGDTR
jgi:cbb3-type cytochrome oxidase cytochrome c subunit